MKSMLHGFLLSIQFLTRFPVPFNVPWNAKTSRWALRCYPLTGVLIGGATGFIGYISNEFISSGAAALLVLTIWVVLTGGLHLDGWMDTADAVGSNQPLEKKWVIMKDPHVGSFGLLSVLFLLAWKYVFLVYLLEEQSFLFFSLILLTVSITRAGAVYLLIFAPTAKKQGLAFEWQKSSSKVDLFISLLPVGIVFLFIDLSLAVLLPFVFLFYFVWKLWMIKHFKGSNGDLIGAGMEGGELWMLLLVSLFVYLGMV